MASFKITNNTIKAPRLDKHGEDVRTVIQKTGYTVQWRDEKNNIISMKQNAKPRFVEQLTPALMRLEQNGDIAIERSEHSVFEFMRLFTQSENNKPDAVSPVKAEEKKSLVTLVGDEGKEIKIEDLGKFQGEDHIKKEDFIVTAKSSIPVDDNSSKFTITADTATIKKEYNKKR